MKELILGRTNLRTAKCGFGALPIQRVDKDYAAMLLRKAFDAGITFFDTARMYTDSEEKIGYALSGVRDKIILATKTMAKTAGGFREDLNKSLELLKTDYIDLYQFHMPDFCPKPGDESGLYDEMLKAKEEGKIRFIGLTNHKLPIAREAVLSGLYDTVQYPLCYLASEEELELVRLCGRENVGFIAMKALSGGLLNRADAAFAWMYGVPGALPIWGIQRESELCEFISYMKNPPALDGGLEAVIERDKRELSGDFCRGCGYCAPCPAGIAIETAARMSQLIRRAPPEPWLAPDKREMMERITECVECRECVARCPYGHDIPRLLKRNLEDYRKILSGEITIER